LSATNVQSSSIMGAPQQFETAGADLTKRERPWSELAGIIMIGWTHFLPVALLIAIVAGLTLKRH